jgi:hypothetical protein
LASVPLYKKNDFGVTSISLSKQKWLAFPPRKEGRMETPSPNYPKIVPIIIPK